MIVGDDDGLCAIPGSAAGPVVVGAKKKQAVEARVMRRPRQGESTLDIPGIEIGGKA